MTKLAAFLQPMGLTLALQKRRSKVWKVLDAVNTVFEKFGDLPEKAPKNIRTGLGQLNDVVGTRTRAIQRQLKNVQSLPAAESRDVLPEFLGGGGRKGKKIH